MKANAPEKLYIFNPERRGLWFSKTSDKQVEYTRTDAFIEKAAIWLKEQDEMVGISFTEDFITRFKNYMKEE